MALPDALIEEAARRFALLSDPTRLRVLRALLEHGEATVSELADALGIATPNVSQHLARLSTSGMVARRREGRTARYSVSDPTVGSLCDLVCSSLLRGAATSGVAGRQEVD